MMPINPSSSHKRKLEAIIGKLTTQSELNSAIPAGDSPVTNIDSVNYHSDNSPVSKRHKTDDTQCQGNSATMELKSESYFPGEHNTSSTNPIIESIKANFFQQRESTLRTHLLEPTISSFPSNQISQATSPTSSEQYQQQHQQAPEQPEAAPDASTSGSNPVKVTNVYRGLYPIKNVKEYFKKRTIDNKKLYSCLWPGCAFQTWKYSQHISRHIYLKHIGIKELRCQVAGCEKVFKRPESLVQHVKNHICGFGIDPLRMKDPANICGVKNIKRHFNKIMDNDIQVFRCQVAKCKFVTNNSGSIRRHVHNQHICPHSSPASQSAAAANGTAGKASTAIDATAGVTSMADLARPPAATSPFLNNFSCPDSTSSSASVTADDDNSTTFDPLLVVLTEYEGQTYDPVNRSINHETENGNGHTDQSSASDFNADSPMDLSGFSIQGINSSILNRLDDDEDEVEDGNKDGNQAQMMPNKEALKTGPTFANDLFFTLPPDNPSVTSLTDVINNYSFQGLPSAPVSSAGSLPGYLQQGLIISENPPSSSMDASVIEDAAAAAARRKNNGLYSLKNYKEHYYKMKTPEAGVQFICKGCQFQAKSQITLIRHLWNELGYKEFHCEFDGCDRTFDNEFSRYKHRKFDHGQPTQPPSVQEAASTMLNVSRADTAGQQLAVGSALADGAFSPIPLPPPASQWATNHIPTSNSSYNNLATALLTIGQSPMPPTSTISHSAAYPSGSYFSVPPISQHHFGVPPTQTSSLTLPQIGPPPPLSHLPSHPYLSLGASSSSSSSSTLPTTATFTSVNCSSVDRLGPTALSASPRRRSNGSLSDASTSSGALNSSLISILQAPSMANAAINSILPPQLPPSFAQQHSARLLDSQPLVTMPLLDDSLNGLFPRPLHSSSPHGANGNSPADQRRSSSGFFSLKQYGDRFDRQYLPNGDVLYRCLQCPTYVVRSQVSIVKHMRAHERGDIPETGEDVNSNRMATVDEQQPSRPRASSLAFSSGAFSSGGEVDDEEEEDREILVEDDEVNVTGESTGGNVSECTNLVQQQGKTGSTRKYNCRSKSGLYSLKKHESDYIRSKGPDGYHYKCANCDEYTTKSQASMVRHIWTHKKQNFRCDCGDSFENEFSLYKHKKTKHPELTSQHNRASSKGSAASKQKQALATAAASSGAGPLTSGSSIDQTEPTIQPFGIPFPDAHPDSSTLNAEQMHQQQVFFNWINQAQQFLAFQQLQQHMANAESNGERPEMMLNQSAANLAQMYASLANDAKEEDDDSEADTAEDHEETHSDTTKGGDSKSEGMSRRALRFKSTKRKPVQIKPEDSDEEDEVKKNEETDNDS